MTWDFVQDRLKSQYTEEFINVIVDVIFAMESVTNLTKFHVIKDLKICGWISKTVESGYQQFQLDFNLLSTSIQNQVLLMLSKTTTWHVNQMFVIEFLLNRVWQPTSSELVECCSWSEATNFWRFSFSFFKLFIVSFVTSSTEPSVMRRSWYRICYYASRMRTWLQAYFKLKLTV